MLFSQMSELIICMCVKSVLPEFEEWLDARDYWKKFYLRIT